jgi:type II secretory pathway component PulF
MRLFPQEVAPARPAVSAGRWLPALRRGAPGPVAVFTRHLAVLLASGVPLAEALSVLAAQCEHRPLARALAEVQEAVSAGRSLAESLAAHQRFFDAPYAGVVASGETSGAMAETLGRLADFLERRRVVQSRLASALIYPALLVVLVVGVFAFISGWVVPMLSPLLAQRRGPLPLATWTLFRVSDLVRYQGWTVPAALALAALAVAVWRRTRAGRRRLDALALRLPLVGRLLLKAAVSRFAATLSMLLRTGVPAVEALAAVRPMMANAAFDQEIESIREAVVAGQDLSARMRSSALFPPMVGYVAAVGERSGALAEALERLAGAYDLEVEVAARRLLAVLEPALILALAAVIGFIAASMMITILELSRL